MAITVIKIVLRKDEALLADSFLRRFSDANELNPTEAETQALVNLGIEEWESLEGLRSEYAAVDEQFKDRMPHRNEPVEEVEEGG